MLQCRDSGAFPDRGLLCATVAISPFGSTIGEIGGIWGIIDPLAGFFALTVRTKIAQFPATLRGDSRVFRFSVSPLV
jgi:hypothetical protein